MKTRINQRNRGLSEVVTTLIILVVAVLLAAVVTYYATNITMTRTQVEEIRFSKEKVWVNYTGAVAAFKIQNLGGRDMLLDRIAFRGVVSDWTDVYYYRVPSGIAITGEMNATSYATLTGDLVELFGRNYTRADTDIPLMSGGVLLIYVKGPDNIQVDDIGTTVAISVFSNNAQYITECNVESATRQ